MNNPLQEYPHLFANGKFKIRCDSINIDNRITGIEDADSNYGCFYVEGQVAPINQCTLIARPISDMTEEELSKWANSHDRVKDPLSEIYAKATSYMLSIGVYPFDQQAFENGTVIDINEV